MRATFHVSRLVRDPAPPFKSKPADLWPTVVGPIGLGLAIVIALDEVFANGEGAVEVRRV